MVTNKIHNAATNIFQVIVKKPAKSLQALQSYGPLFIQKWQILLVCSLTQTVVV
jgi:hypothetical protein